MNDFFITYLHNIIMVIIFVLSLFSLIKGFVCTQKPLIVVGIISISLLILNAVLYLLNLQINPIIKNVILLRNIFLLFFMVSISYKKRVIKVLSLISSVIVSVIISLVVYFFNVGVTYVNNNDGSYVGVYEALTGISESKVYYYKNYGIVFIDGTWSYMENYGIVLSGTDTIFDREPYDKVYNSGYSDK